MMSLDHLQRQFDEDAQPLLAAAIVEVIQGDDDLITSLYERVLGGMEMADVEQYMPMIDAAIGRALEATLYKLDPMGYLRLRLWQTATQAPAGDRMGCLQWLDETFPEFVLLWVNLNKTTLLDDTFEKAKKSFRMWADGKKVPAPAGIQYVIKTWKEEGTQ